MMTTFVGTVLTSAIRLPANAAPATSATTAGQCGHGHCRHHRHCHRRCHPLPPKPGTLSGYQVVSEKFKPDPTSVESHVVRCPAGKVPTGGGVRTDSFAAGSQIIGSAPVFSATLGNGWEGEFVTGATASEYTITAICAFNH